MKNSTLTRMNEESGILISVGFILFGIICGIFGARLFRIVTSICLSVLAFYGVYTLSDQSKGISCDSRLIVSLLLSLVVALMTGCLISLAVFLIGAFSFMFLVHLLFVSFPELHTAF